jgi:hypothetical protein
MTKDQPGYRGSLPTRDDRLARPWIIIVFAIFVAILLLSALEIPSRFEPEPTPLPIPSDSAVPVPSIPEPEPSGSGAPASESASPSATPEP